MSGRRLAEAYLQLDVDLATFVDLAPTLDELDEYLAAHVANTWTLSLAARCAGVTEDAARAAIRRAALRASARLFAQRESRNRQCTTDDSFFRC